MVPQEDGGELGERLDVDPQAESWAVGEFPAVPPLPKRESKGEVE